MRLRFQSSKSTDNTKIYVSTAARQHLEGLDGPFLTHPEQTSDADVNLVDQRQILVAFGVLDFIDADGVDLAKRSGCVCRRPRERLRRPPRHSVGNRRAASHTAGIRRIPTKG